MKRTVLICCTLIGLTVVAARTAEPAAEPQPKPEKEAPAETAAELAGPVIPERKLEFEVSETPVFEWISAESIGDPTIMALRFEAIVQIAPPSVAIGGGLPGFDVAPHYGLKPGVGTASVDPNYVLRHAVTWGGFPGQWLPFVVDFMPKERQPSAELVAELEQCSLLFHGGGGGGLTGETHVLRIRAPTVERAKELVPQFLAVLDWGLCYPSRQKCLEERQRLQKRVLELRALAEEQEKETARLKKELEGLEEFKDLDKEALSGLTTQQRLIDVDLAGVAAQIAACNRILKDSPDNVAGVRSPRSEQVETLKITAEIELVGLTARKAAIHAIVEKARARSSLSAKVAQAWSQARRKEIEIQKLEKAVIQLEESYKAYMPFPVQGKIEIHPIKWEVVQEK